MSFSKTISNTPTHTLTNSIHDTRQVRRVIVDETEPITPITLISKPIEKVFRDSSTQTDVERPSCEICRRDFKNLSACHGCTRFLVTYRDEYVTNQSHQAYTLKKQQINVERERREQRYRRQREAENSSLAFSNLLSRPEMNNIVSREDRASTRHQRNTLKTIENQAEKPKFPPLMSINSSKRTINISPEPSTPQIPPIPPTTTVNKTIETVDDEFSMIDEINFPTVD